MNIQRIVSPQEKNTVCTDCAVKDQSALKNCPEECLELISSAKGVIAYLKGQMIVIEGTVSPYVYCVKSGKIKIFTANGDGQETIIRFAKPGDILGFEHVENLKEHKMSVIAMEDALLCYFDHNVFLQLIRRYPELSLGLLKYYKEEFQNAMLNSAKLAHLKVSGKVAFALLMMQDVYGFNKVDHTLNLSLTRKDLANLAFTTKEQVSKVLASFKEQGIIETNGNSRIAITNTDVLRMLAEVWDVSCL